MVWFLMAHVGREFAGSRTLRPHVYRRGVPPVHMGAEFAGRPQTGGRRVPPRRLPVPVRPEFRAAVQTRPRCVPAPIASVLTWPEFRAGLQTRPRCVPAPDATRTRGARVYGASENSRQDCTARSILVNHAREVRECRQSENSSTRVPTPFASGFAHTQIPTVTP